MQSISVREQSLFINKCKIIYYELIPPSSQNNHDTKQLKQILICCPGWSGSASLLATDLNIVSYNGCVAVFAIEWRGHGYSDAGDENITVSLLAEDLHHFIKHILQRFSSSSCCKVSLLGHSMGVNVIWRYIDVFGEANIDRYIFVDQPVAICGTKRGKQFGYKDEWTVHGQFVSYVIACVYASKNYLILPLASLFTKLTRIPVWLTKDLLDFLYRSNGMSLAKLLMDTTTADNIDRIPKVKRPCLIYGGESSFPSSPDVARWISSHVSGPNRVIIYPKPYGTHVPFSVSMAPDQVEIGAKRFTEDLLSFLEADEKNI